MDRHRGLLGIRRIDRVPNARIRELCGVTKGEDERIDESVLRWFNHTERRGKDKSFKMVYVMDGMGSQPRKDGLIQKDSLKKIRIRCWAAKENGA